MADFYCGMLISNLSALDSLYRFGRFGLNAVFATTIVFYYNAMVADLLRY
ncbi:hypothetical protein BDN67DRAFT_1018012 [Paxillus ammoniavirescens]|nr:hypothetical protein BDN67DRAFT_1018012 [Paxillus ammoniavirescens]